MVIATNPEPTKTTTQSAALQNASDPNFQSPSTAPSFISFSRAPLVPEAVLKRHGAYCAIDTRFRAAARLQQAIWLKEQNIQTAADDHAGRSGRSFLGSILSTDAARAGKNFLTTEIHRLALREWLLCEDDAAIDPERLFGNALSSMPLCLSLFGPMALDLTLATSVFRELLPGFVHKVEQIIFEHSPGRRNDRFLSDRTAFDLAVRVGCATATTRPRKRSASTAILTARSCGHWQSNSFGASICWPNLPSTTASPHARYSWPSVHASIGAFRRRSAFTKPN